MRKKLRELFSKEEGFTLVELLATLVILGIILMIAVPGIGKVVDNAKAKAKSEEQQVIIDAAQIYFVQTEDADGKVTVTELIDEGYLENKTGLSGTVTLKKDSNKFTYEFTETATQ